MPLRRRPIALLAILAAVALAAFLLRRGSFSWSEPEPVADAWPAGRWRLAEPAKAGGPGGEDAARVLSLPYSAGSAPAPAESGVAVHDRARASAGINLYTSGHGPEAILMDMGGRVLHRWRQPFERAFPGKAPSVETPFFRRAHLFPDGRLLALYQGGGLVELDRDSRVLWTVDAGFYNDLFVAPDGTVWSLTKEAKLLPAVNPEQPALEDSVLVVGADGRVRDRISILRALLDSPFAALFAPHAPAGDILHSNTIEVFDGSLAARSPLFAAGNVLLSLREIDTLAILDPRARRLVWARRGPWSRQHQPTLLADGHLLLFDNRPWEKGSRVLEIDPLSSEVFWRYPPENAGPGRALFSEEAGAAQRLPNGNTLITESDGGRALEVTPAGETVWEFWNPHRTGKRNQLIATLFEVVRYEPGYGADGWGWVTAKPEPARGSS